MTSSLIRKYDVIIVILMSWQLRKWKVFIVLCFGWIKLKFGVRSNFTLLISNLNSETQYHFEIVRKCHFSSLRSWFLAQHYLMNWLPWQQWMTYLQYLNFKNFYIWLLKNDISLVKISWTVYEIFSQGPRKTSIFSAVAFWWRHKINMTMTSSNFLSVCRDFYP